MKKVMLVIAAVAFVAALSTSCAKDCTCKGKLGDNKDWSYTYDKTALKATGLKCKDIKDLWKDVEGVECK